VDSTLLAWISLAGQVVTINTDDNSVVLSAKIHDGSVYAPFAVCLTLTDDNECGALNGAQSSTSCFDLTITPFNHAPVLTAIADQEATANIPLSIAFPVLNDQDLEEVFTFELLDSGDNSDVIENAVGITLDLVLGKIVVDINDNIHAGDYNLRFKVTDGDVVLSGLQKSQFVDFYMRVIPFNYAPTFETSLASLKFSMFNYNSLELNLPLCEDENPNDVHTLFLEYTFLSGI